MEQYLEKVLEILKEGYARDGVGPLTDEGVRLVSDTIKVLEDIRLEDRKEAMAKDHPRRLEDILSKFKKSRELYGIDPTYTVCIKSLESGADVYRLLEDVIIMSIEQNKRFAKILETGAIRQEIVVSKERFEEIENSIKQ